MVCVYVCVCMGVCGCVYLCVCVWLWGGSQCPPGCNSPDGPPWACSEVFCPMVVMGWAGISFPRHHRALSICLMVTISILPSFLPLASLMSPGLGKDQGATGLWSFPAFLQMGNWHSDFPFYSLSVVTFKGLFVSSGTFFHRCGQNLGVGTLLLSPEHLCWRGRVAGAEIGLCSVSQARAALETRANAVSRIIFLSHSWWLHLERGGPGEHWWVRHGRKWSRRRLGSGEGGSFRAGPPSSSLSQLNTERVMGAALERPRRWERRKESLRPQRQATCKVRWFWAFDSSIYLAICFFLNLIMYFSWRWSSLLCELFISHGSRLTLNHWATREALCHLLPQ